MKSAVFLLLAIPGLAFAVEDKEIAECAAVSNTVSRISCYDAIAERHSLAPRVENTATQGKGKWQTSTEVDPLNDKNVYLATLSATNGRSKWNKPISVTVRCSDNETELFINWNDFLGSDAYTTIRIDKEKATKANWTLSTDKVAAFYPGSPVSVLKKISGSKSFIASVTPYNESPVTAVFDTSGAEAAFADIRKGCGW
ncbi:type VI secretion system-associated protein TagO [Pseudomonas denitrificans (nom. rej.)]|nr:type VI secretion system-associated protein TagO [Pseudomonas denitrificans (nom. rej.)]